MPRRSEHLAIFSKSLAGGGAQRVLLDLAGEFARRGHRVDLLLAQRTGPLLAEVPAAVRLIDLEVQSAWRGLPGMLRFPSDVLPLLGPYAVASPPRVFAGVERLAAYLDSERPRAMLSGVDFTNLAALLAARLANAPTRQVVSVHNTLSAVVERREPGRMRFLPELIRRLFPEADAITTCSEGVADDLAALCGIPRDTITPIYNPIVGERTRALAEQASDHPWLAPGQPPVVLGVGRLAPQKDFSLLLRAFARAREQRPLRLVILGEGPERPRLEALARRLAIEADVRMPGWVSNPLAFARRASLFVCSSAWEGFGNVLVEALSVGCPCVSTRTQGPVEILEDGRIGRLVPHGDPAALCDAMLATLEDPPDADTGRKRAQVFSVDRSADRFLGLLLGEPARPAGRADTPA